LIDKLSPELRVHLRAPKAREIATAAPSAPEPKVKRTEILVEFNGDIADLIAVGFRPRSVLTHPVEGHTIATGILPVDRLTDLAAIEHVVEIEGPQKYTAHLNYSVPAIHADAVQTGSPSRTGRNVVIGIIDSGVDWRHGDFFDPTTKKSRILEIWDQRLDADVGETVGPIVEGDDPLGVLYNQDEITEAFNSDDEKKVRSRDESPHGTHVAGIAAGNGLPPSCCHRPHTYVGVAPDALLLVVRLYNEHRELGENIRLVDAIKYIFDHPQVKGATPAQRRPAVINISQGQNRGAHDGTAMVERAINTAVATPGRAVVVSAGNHANERCHVTASVPKRTAAKPAELEFEFNMPKGRKDEAWIDIWYQRAGTLHIVVESPDGETSGTVNQGTDHDFVANPDAPDDAQSTVSVVSRINNPFSRDNNWRIQIAEPDDGNLPHGSWTIRLINPGASEVSFHAWIERGDPDPTFVDPIGAPDDEITASPDSTVSIPATAAGAITVASHLNKAHCCECNPKEGVMRASGQGPVARGAATNQKPDIAAPGFKITSAKADARNFPGHCCSCCPNACCTLYEDKNGTSMAAPHVTGTIALMLEENPHLTKDDILTHLRASATPRPPGVSADRWGAGKLNAEKAVAAVRAAGGGGGGGGNGPHLNVSPDSGGGAWSRMHPALSALREGLMAQPEGVAVAAAVSCHFSEVRRLINTNRRVATLWHRAAGPCLLRELLQGAVHPCGSAALLGGPNREYLDRWWDLLARYGSPRLKTGLQRYRSIVMDLLRTRLAARPETEATGPVGATPGIEALVGP
jgi:subtilisin family serine protease